MVKVPRGNFAERADEPDLKTSVEEELGLIERFGVRSL